MSRCFPFPPPGYEKKARLEDLDLLKKEKSREKRLKKEKKEKKDKEQKHKGSEEKRKEKKESRVKDREKRKDKDKEQEKTRTSDEKTLLGKRENHNGGNLAHQGRKVNDNSILYELYSGQSAGYTGAKLIQGNHLSEKTKGSELVQDTGNKIEDKNVEKFSTTQPKRDDKMVRLVAKGSATLMEVVEKIGELGTSEEPRFSTGAMVQNPAVAVRTGVQVVSKPAVEKKESKSSEKKAETKEEIKDGEGNGKRKEKHEEKDREKKVKTKDKEREKEKRKEEKAKEKHEDRRGEMNASKESNKENFLSAHSMKASQLPEEVVKSAAIEGNFKKRKDFETNGFMHGDDIRPIKIQKVTSFSHPSPGNGKILEPCHDPITSASERQGIANNFKLDRKEGKINGVIEAHPSFSSIKSTAPRQVDQIAAPPPKPPHPDCRYLSQIYSLPKVEEWSDFCDQDWLSKSSSLVERKPKSSEVEEIPQVWAEALAIESADICALPYVIPY